MADNLSNDMKSLQINESSDAGGVKKVTENCFEDWLFPLEDLYKYALTFYKEQDGRGLHLTYRDKLKMVALTKQVVHGKYRADVSPDVGFLDVVGSDRKQAWMSLGDMSKTVAMGEFVKMLDSVCPQFRPYIQAQKAEKEEQAQKKREEEELRKKEAEEQERKLLENEAQRQLLLERQRQLEQEKQIKAALNQQTAVQFQQYAEQQHPGNLKQQEELIAQLQEQHFQQYMQQVYQQQLLQQQQQYQQLQAMQANQKAETTQGSQAAPVQAPAIVQNGLVTPPTNLNTQEHDEEKPRDEENVTPLGCPTISQAVMWTRKDIDGFRKEMRLFKDNIIHIGSLASVTDELPPIAAASMWTKKEIKEFKLSLKNDKDSVIKVGSGETVTVRVPTHEDGSCLFWEFATDYYDIGFGVYFEWTIAPSNAVSVHVSESSDEEDIDEQENKGNDVEKGDKHDDKPPVDEIMPVYRRDCHEEVYCGSHTYPGRGVYLLKFDNSYSLWRSKTLYYRVYYSR